MKKLVLSILLLNYYDRTALLIINYRIITATIILLVIGIIFPSSIYTSSYNEQESHANNNLTNSSIENTPYFSIEIPDDWTYETSSNSYATELIGFGVVNTIGLAPAELYAKHGFNFSSNSVAALFYQDVYYSIKNSPLENYVDPNKNKWQEVYGM